MGMKELQAPIRYQVGNNYYEDRIMKFVNMRPNYKGKRIVLNYRCKNNFGIASYHKNTKMIVILNDCKYNMADTDISKI